MRKELKKKKWVKPGLIILTRGKDGAERVLGVCKGPGHVGPWGGIGICIVGPHGEITGVACSGFSPS